MFTPVFIPYPYNKLSIFLNTLLISRSIRRWIKVVKFYEPICISFLPTPAVQEIIRNIDPSLKIYYCADDMSRSLANPNKLDKLFGDECYSSAKIEALGFRAKKTLKDMNKTSF